MMKLICIGPRLAAFRQVVAASDVTLTVAACVPGGNEPLNVSTAATATESVKLKLGDQEREKPLWRALDLITANDLEGANKTLNTALSMNPEDADMHFLNAYVYEIRGRSEGLEVAEQAPAGYLAAFNNDSHHWAAAYRLGLWHLHAKEYRRARRWLGEAALIKDDSAEIFEALATASYMSFDPDAADAFLARAAELSGETAEIVRGRAIVSAAQNRRDDANEQFEKYAEMGGVVEEFLEADEVRSPSVQLRITPAGELRIISTHDQALGGESGQVYLGCAFPASDEYRAMITERAHFVGEVLRDHGVIGRFAIDFLVFRDPGQEWRCSAIEINLRMGGTTFPFIALDFLTGGSLAGSGDYRTRTGAAKFYFATDVLTSSSYRGLLPQDFLEIVIHHGLHFSPSTETGVLFHMIGALSQYGKIGVICIGNSPQEAADLYKRTRDVLDTETDATRTDKGQLMSMFDDFPHLYD